MELQELFTQDQADRKLDWNNSEIVKEVTARDKSRLQAVYKILDFGTALSSQDKHYAASLDRYLGSIGKPQKFGTQFRFINNTWQLAEYDPKTTDAERAKYNVPPIAQQLEKATKYK